MNPVSLFVDNKFILFYRIGKLCSSKNPRKCQIGALDYNQMETSLFLESRYSASNLENQK
jgi:hypothetical protein